MHKKNKIIVKNIEKQINTIMILKIIFKIDILKTIKQK